MLIFNDHYNSHYIEYFMLIILTRCNHFAYIWLLVIFFLICVQKKQSYQMKMAYLFILLVFLYYLERTNGRKTKKKVRERLNELIKNFIKKRKNVLFPFTCPLYGWRRRRRRQHWQCAIVSVIFTFSKKKMNST